MPRQGEGNTRGRCPLPPPPVPLWWQALNTSIQEGMLMAMRRPSPWIPWSGPLGLWPRLWPLDLQVNPLIHASGRNFHRVSAMPQPGVAGLSPNSQTLPHSHMPLLLLAALHPTLPPPPSCATLLLPLTFSFCIPHCPQSPQSPLRPEHPTF